MPDFSLIKTKQFQSNLKKDYERFKIIKLQSKKRFWLVIAILMLNILLDLGLYFFMTNSKMILALCLFLNSISLRWIFRKYEIHKRSTLTQYRFYGITNFLIASSVFLLINLIYKKLF